MSNSQVSSLQTLSLAAIDNEPLSLLANLRRTHVFSTDDGSTAFMHDIYRTAQDTATSTLQNEKLEIGRDGAQYLSSVLKEVSSLHAGSSLTEGERTAGFANSVVKGEYKPDISEPIKKLLQSVTGLYMREDPALLLNEAVPKLIASETACSAEGLEFPEHFWELPAIVEQNFRTEKTNASKDTARFLKSVMEYFDENEQRREMDEPMSSAVSEWFQKTCCIYSYCH